MKTFNEIINESIGKKVTEDYNTFLLEKQYFITKKTMMILTEQDEDTGDPEDDERAGTHFHPHLGSKYFVHLDVDGKREIRVVNTPKEAAMIAQKHPGTVAYNFKGDQLNLNSSMQEAYLNEDDRSKRGMESNQDDSDWTDYINPWNLIPGSIDSLSSAWEKKDKGAAVRATATDFAQDRRGLEMINNFLMPNPSKTVDERDEEVKNRNDRLAKYEQDTWKLGWKTANDIPVPDTNPDAPSLPGDEKQKREELKHFKQFNSIVSKYQGKELQNYYDLNPEEFDKHEKFMDSHTAASLMPISVSNSRGSALPRDLSNTVTDSLAKTVASTPEMAATGIGLAAAPVVAGGLAASTGLAAPEVASSVIGHIITKGLAAKGAADIGRMSSGEESPDIVKSALAGSMVAPVVAPAILPRDVAIKGEPSVKSDITRTNLPEFPKAEELAKEQAKKVALDWPNTRKFDLAKAVDSFENLPSDQQAALSRQADVMASVNMPPDLMPSTYLRAGMPGSRVRAVGGGNKMYPRYISNKEQARLLRTNLSDAERNIILKSTQKKLGKLIGKGFGQRVAEAPTSVEKRVSDLLVSMGVSPESITPEFLAQTRTNLGITGTETTDVPIEITPDTKYRGYKLGMPIPPFPLPKRPAEYSSFEDYKKSKEKELSDTETKDLEKEYEKDIRQKEQLSPKEREPSISNVGNVSRASILSRIGKNPAAKAAAISMTLPSTVDLTTGVNDVVGIVTKAVERNAKPEAEGPLKLAYQETQAPKISTAEIAKNTDGVQKISTGGMNQVMDLSQIPDETEPEFTSISKPEAPSVPEVPAIAETPKRVAIPKVSPAFIPNTFTAPVEQTKSNRVKAIEQPNATPGVSSDQIKSFASMFKYAGPSIPTDVVRYGFGSPSGRGAPAIQITKQQQQTPAPAIQITKQQQQTPAPAIQITKQQQQTADTSNTPAASTNKNLVVNTAVASPAIISIVNKEVSKAGGNNRSSGSSGEESKGKGKPSTGGGGYEPEQKEHETISSRPDISQGTKNWDLLLKHIYGKYAGTLTK